MRGAGRPEAESLQLLSGIGVANKPYDPTIKALVETDTAARGARDSLGLPPHVGREKLVEATEQRTLTGQRSSRVHEPFLPEGWCDQPHSEAKRLFQLRQTANSSSATS
jgi:hypothetical protein